MSDDEIAARLRNVADVEPFAPLCHKAADEIERLRAELAAEREAKQCAVDQAETFREERDAMFAALCTLRARRQIVYSPDAQAMSDRVKAAEAERDALRAELAAERERAEAHFLAAQEADDELATIRAERDALRAVLRPFAKAADNFDSFPIKDAEGWFAYSGQSSFNKVTGAITVGDLRRARAALKGDDRD